MNNAIIIVHYNDYESLNNLLKNIKDYKNLDKIIIVDNNSNKDIVDKLRLINSDKVILIENDINRGFGYAINTGAKKCKELGIQNIIISNCDVIIEKESDLNLLFNYLQNEDIGVVAPIIKEKNSINRGWKNPTPFLDILMNLIIIHRRIRTKHILYNNDHYQNNFSDVEVISGCFFLMKIDTLEKINYFDENVFLYYEENILSKKINKIGKRIIIVNDVEVIHNHSVSIDKNVSKIKKLKLQKKSQLYFHKVYNKANIFERILLVVTAFLSSFILRIVYTIKDLLHKKS